MDRLFRRQERQGPVPERPALEPIRVYARDIEVAGWVTPAGERVTDLLQPGSELRFLPDGADPDDPDGWLGLVTDSVLFVVPPPHVSPPEKRLHRQTQRIRLRVGDYTLYGTAHLRPGFEQDLMLRATQPFLPLTDAVVVTAQGETRHEVVIVNLSEVEELDQA
jgi:hypothetical protein